SDSICTPCCRSRRRQHDLGRSPPPFMAANACLSAVNHAGPVATRTGLGAHAVAGRTCLVLVARGGIVDEAYRRILVQQRRLAGSLAAVALKYAAAITFRTCCHDQSPIAACDNTMLIDVGLYC